MHMARLRTAWEGLPVQTLDALLAGRRPLVLAPHPDDESLGCGGLLAQCAASGIAAQVAILTDGRHSHPGSLTHPPEVLAAARRREAGAALRQPGLGSDHLHWLGAEDTRLPPRGPAAAAILTALGRICDECRCSLILAPWRGDPHCDHEAAAALARALCAARGLPCLFYPVWGFLAKADILRLAALARRAILPRGRILLVNWLGAAAEPQPGDIAAEHFIAAVGFQVVTATKEPLYRLDLLAST